MAISDSVSAWVSGADDSGPSTAPEESLEKYIERRYYETLFLGEVGCGG